MKTLAPLGDVLRVVSFDELPPRVKEIPADLDPLADGILMAHQSDWLAEASDFKVAEKGRRTGITWAEALGDTLIAAARKSAGGDNVYYIGDTKEKGLEFIGYCARFSQTIAEAQGSGMSGIEEFLFEDQQPDGTTKYINAYRVRYASGFQIVALSSRPANIRGLQGIVVIDEAAFHANVQAVIEATTALLIWGGKIRIISTHNGKRNAFNQLVKDVRQSRYGEGAVVKTYTFDTAVANGLYERVCMVRGWTPTVDGKRSWYDRIRQRYGPRRAAMREELDAIPRDSGGQAIPSVWIEEAMREARPVLRITLDDDFAQRTDADRRGWAEDWIRGNLAPLLDKLDPRQEHVLGQDFARHRDFSIIAPLAITSTLTRRQPFQVEMHKVPTRQQEQILWAILSRLPRFSGAAIDATGNGAILAEYTADRFGLDKVHQVLLNNAWYRDNMPKFVQAFEDGTIDLVRDANTENDLRALEEIDGIVKLPDVRIQDMEDPDLFRHGDSAIALALAWFASINRVQEAFGYRPVTTAYSPDHDHQPRAVCCTGGFRRGVL